jgi:hypothetical protein
MFAVANGWRSRNGLPQTTYTGRCPACREFRSHMAVGPRRCPCGCMYTLVVTATVGTAAEAAIA